MSAGNAARFAQATSALNATGLGSQTGVTTFDATSRILETTALRPAA